VLFILKINLISSLSSFFLWIKNSTIFMNQRLLLFPLRIYAIIIFFPIRFTKQTKRYEKYARDNQLRPYEFLYYFHMSDRKPSKNILKNVHGNMQSSELFFLTSPTFRFFTLIRHLNKKYMKKKKFFQQQ
jgi:hypothetical protein